MEITIDIWAIINYLLNIGNNPPIIITWIIFKNGGWIFVLWAFFWGFKRMWMDHIWSKYGSAIKYILLTINIPKENEQSPKAVEHIFSQLLGASGSSNLIEKYWEGKSQPKFSLEIISIDGNIQFIIRTQEKFRDLIEATIYAQYPEAEIFEIADYVQNIPIEKFPSEEYEMAGAEMVLEKSSIYPIKTYPSFEHPLTQEFKDPLVALLEILSKLHKGEQIWIQIIIIPSFDVSKALFKKGIVAINKMAGKRESPSPEHIGDKGVSLFMNTLDWIGEIIYPLWGPPAKKEKEELSKMLHLTSGEKVVMEAIEQKISKPGFKTKIRFMYLAKKEIYHSGRGENPIFGAFQQFNTLNLNSFKPHLKTMAKGRYFFKKTKKAYRQNNMFNAYKGRDDDRGASMFVLNIEELATIFHFPILTIIKTPQIAKTKSRTAEAPFDLPTGDDDIAFDQTFGRKLHSISLPTKNKKEQLPPPINLPTSVAPPDNLPTK